MSLVWLAAILSPRDIAHHPNFTSKESTIGPAAIADRLVPSRGSRDELAAELYSGEIGAEFTARALSALQDLIQFGKVEPAADSFAALASESYAQTGEIGFAASMAILSAAGYAEIDNLASSLAVLDALLVTLPEYPANDERLAYGACLQQRALRMYDFQHEGIAESRQVVDLLSEFDPSQSREFEVSAGVAWSSRTTLSNISEMLVHGAKRIQAQLADLDDDLWVSLVREGPPALLMKNAMYSTESYVSLLRHDFSQFSSRSVGHQNGRNVGSGPNEVQLWEVAFAAELLGHPSVRSLREELGLYRIVGSNAGFEMRQEALRLLRQSKSSRHLTSALKMTRTSGPIDALRGDALQVLHNRLPDLRVGAADLTTLRMSAGVLTVDEASTGVDLTVRLLDENHLVSDGHRGSAISWRVEVLGTVIELARTSGRTDEAGRALLKVTELFDGSNEVTDIKLSELLPRLEWSSLSAEVVGLWESWYRAHSADEFPAVRKGLSTLIAPSEPNEVWNDPVSLESIAQSVNQAIQSDPTSPFQAPNGAEGVLADSLRQLEDEVARGVFGFGGIPTLELAVAYSIAADSRTLWPTIWKILYNPSVLRSISAGAFERLARSEVAVPESVREHFVQRTEPLLNASDAPFAKSEYPYPAALRFFTTKRILTGDEVLSRVSVLAAGDSSASRLEAARTMTTMLRQGMAPNWIAALSINLSYDSESLVRAEASRSLVLIGTRRKKLRGLAFSRIAELLDSDGSSIPLLAVETLGEVSKKSLPKPIVAKVRRMAQQHRVYDVRCAAERSVSRWDGP